MTPQVDPGMEAVPLGTRVARAMQAPGMWAGGTTRAIHSYPPGPGLTPATALFWVGTAVIERAAPYSYFPGRTRIHIPIHGNGIRLHFQAPAEVIALDRFEQYRFDGARPVQVELVDGPVVAFNLIAQSELSIQADVSRMAAQEVVSAFPGPPAPAHAAEGMSVVRVVYAAGGAIAIWVAGRELARLEPGDAFVMHPRPTPLSLDEQVELRCVAAYADIVVATIAHRGDA